MANSLIQGLGWFVRRTVKDQYKLAEFYETNFGMRTVRPPAPPPQNNKMLWSGDILMFELSARVADPDGEARMPDTIPVLRARNFDAVVARLAALGMKPIEQMPGTPRYALFKDPDGFFIAIAEPPAGSPYPSDQMADGLWTSGALELPGIAKSGPDIQDMASVIVKVADPVAMAAFYADALGLDAFTPATASGAVLGMGRTTSLTLRPGGVKRSVPKDRNTCPDVWILRTKNLRTSTDRLKAKGVAIVNELKINGGALTYAADPEGHLFGLQQRTPDMYAPDFPIRLEDREIWKLG